jgi:hypothetical protein
MKKGIATLSILGIAMVLLLTGCIQGLTEAQKWGLILGEIESGAMLGTYAATKESPQIAQEVYANIQGIDVSRITGPNDLRQVWKLIEVDQIWMEMAADQLNIIWLYLQAETYKEKELQVLKAVFGGMQRGLRLYFEERRY